MTISVTYSCMFHSIVILYIGSVRSLQFYSFNSTVTTKKNQDEVNGKALKTDNSLINLKTALSVPILATLSLVGAYYMIQNKWTIVNKIAYGYIVFLGTLSLKKYLYEYFKYSSNFARFDYTINMPIRILKVNLTMLELMTLLLCCYFSFLYL